MPKDTGRPITCADCGQTKPADAFHRQGAYRTTRCRACVADHRRTRYHTDPRARALQIAHSISNLVRRKFPEADTQLDAATYADHLLSVTHCEYCGQENDGTHPFNLDHRVALGNGGRHELANLVPCCEPCNRAKRDMPEEVFTAWLDGVAARRVQALAHAAD